MAPPRKTAGATTLTVSRPELLVDGSDHAFRGLVHDSLAFAARLQAVRDGYARIVGVTGPQYTILIAIAHLGRAGDVSVTTIADHLKLSGSFVTNEVGKLVSQGLVAKTADPGDRRRVRLSITPAARQRFARLSEVQAEVNDIHFGPLSRQDFEDLRRIMPALVASTDRALRLLDHLSAELEPDEAA